jgi:hypothetical protein
MSHISRRSFLASSAAAAATASSLLNSAQAVEDIPGFDQTRTDFDRTKSWQPFSDRKFGLGSSATGSANSVWHLISSIIPMSS